MNSKKSRYFSNNRASKFIYGIILLFGFLVSQSHKTENSSLSLGITVLLAGITFTFAEVYSEIIGERIKNRGKVSNNFRREIIRDSSAIASLSAWISVIFLFSYIGLYNIEVAFLISFICLLALLFAASMWAYKLTGFSNNKSLAISIISVAIGLLVIFLKYEFGH